MDTRPIGMFDSGVGGMTVFKEIISNHNENIIYLGDTKRFPYGSKSKETIIELTKRGIEFLIKQNVKLIIIACGTATSQALEEVKDKYGVPIIGIIEPTVKYIKQEQYKNIAVMATAGTIRSKGWEQNILKEIPDAKVYHKACPLLAPMAEEGWTENEIARLTIREYLKELNQREDLDCLILGCTHYPLFAKIIKEELKNKKLKVIDTGKMISEELTNSLENTEEIVTAKEYKIYLTEKETNFIKVAEKLLRNIKIDLQEIKQVEI